MQLNCDLGESYGARQFPTDVLIMPHIDQANIACGMHGGDPLTMRNTLRLAREHGVAVGAHPAYPDLEGFGRNSMCLSEAELIALLHYQLAALEGMALSLGIALSHVKPHGALYNDAMRDAQIRVALLRALASYHQPLPLVLQATPDTEKLLAEAAAFNIEVQLEVFADRAYREDGSLVPRTEAGAVLEAAAMLTQVEQLCTESTVTTVAGTTLTLRADTLCVHGDNPDVAQHIMAIADRVKSTR